MPHLRLNIPPPLSDDLPANYGNASTNTVSPRANVKRQVGIVAHDRHNTCTSISKNVFTPTFAYRSSPNLHVICNTLNRSQRQWLPGLEPFGNRRDSPKNKLVACTAWMLVPRNKFGSSLYNVPLLLALRFFYHASPFEAADQQISHGRSDRDLAQSISHDVPANLSQAFITPQPLPIPKIIPNYADPPNGYQKLTTSTFLTHLNAYSSHYAHSRLVSLTWTKALASPLSHEYIQFIIEDTRTGHRSRIATDRHVDGGDSVHVGWDWFSGEEPSQHHALPLPLLSLTFDKGPKVTDFARLLVEITKQRPEYNLLREMCWWYAEVIFDGARSRFGGRIEEWEFARLRYSFVVRTNVIKREKLVRHAEDFRRMNAREMRY